MKKALEYSINFLLFSNTWVALSMSGLITGLTHYYCIEDIQLYAIFAFTGTFAVYNFHRLIRNRTLQKQQVFTPRILWLNDHRFLLMAACGVTIITAGTIFFFLPVKPVSLILLGISGMIVVFYAVPIPYTGKSLRMIGGLKNTWIVVIWIVLLSVPLINRGKEIHYEDLTLIALFVYIQIIPFDIRDFDYDARSMKTFPQLFGIRGSRIIGTLLLAVFAGLMLVTTPVHWFLCVPVGLSLAGLWRKQSYAANRYLELVWDGCILTLGIFYYLLPCVHS